MIFIRHTKLFFRYHRGVPWRLLFTRPKGAHMTACQIGPFEVTFPDFGYDMPNAKKFDNR